MNYPRVFSVAAFACVIVTSMISTGAAWEESMNRAEALASSGVMDSAAVVLTRTLSTALTEYSESDTTVEVRLSRGGIRQPYYFSSLEEAESLYVRALRLKETISEEDDAELAQIVSDLAFVYLHERKQPEVWDSFERALAIEEALFGPDHVDVAMSVGALATYHNAILGEYDVAESLFIRCLSIQEEAFGPDHVVLTEFMWSYAHMLMNTGRYPEAAAMQERELAIERKAYGPESPKTVGTLNHLVSSYQYLGRYAEAESAGTRSLAISEVEYGPESYYVAMALDGLGMIYQDLGRFAEAEEVLMRSLPIKEQQFGADSRFYGNTCNVLGNLYSSQGRYAEAERFYKKTIEISEHPETGSRNNLGVGLYNLALVYRDQGQYADAEPLLTRAIGLWEDQYGPDHIHVGGGSTELGLLYRKLGRYAEAESLFHRAIAIGDTAYGPGNVDSGRAKKGLADVYLDRGLYAEAESYLREAFDAWERDPGAFVVYMPPTLESLVRLHRHRGDHRAALAAADSAMGMLRDNFMDNYRALSEKDAIAYSQFLINSVHDYLTCFSDLESRNEDLVGRVADVIFSSKGQVSDGIFERQRSLIAETDPVTMDLAEQMRRTKFQLSQLFVEGAGDDIDAYRTMTDSLSGVVNNLEQELSRRSASYRRSRESRDIGTARVTSLLPESSILVEYLKYDYRELSPERSVPRYMAVVMSPEGLKAVTDLGEAGEVEDLIEEWKDHMLRVASSGRLPSIIDQREYEELSRQVYEWVWGPIEEHTGGSGTVLIAPDGALNLIAFAGLKSPDGEYLVEKHALHHLSAGRDLVRLEHAPEPAFGLFALGDPDYGASPTTRLAAVEAPGDSVIQVAFATRNLRTACGELSQTEVTPLPGTRREVELVSQSWEANTVEPLVACYGDEASEEYFKAEAPGSRVIHLATHGYFLGGGCRPEEAGRDYVGENPLLLSGLFFAGANLHGEGADSLGAEDGILTAYEVSAMDLKGTELVVLSACETGLGEVAEGEGVYGLRRAFQMAGARTVVSALWPVSDQDTAEMMSSLHARDDESLPDAMRRVQLEKISELRSRGSVDHPFTWGAFIALGDWR